MPSIQFRSSPVASRGGGRWGCALTLRRILGIVAAVLLATPAVLATEGKTTTGKSGSSNQQTFRDNTYPPDNYFLVRDILASGEYKDALKEFTRLWRVAVRDVDGRWIDSICHYTMIGECYYRLGQPAEALESYTQGLRLFLAYRDWMMRVQWQEVTPSSQGIHLQPIPWGRSQRGSRPGHVAEKVSIGVGKLDNSDAVRQGGVVRLPSIRNIRPAEIVRCTALAMSRRREILGPLCAADPMSQELEKAFSQPLTPLRHWTESWVALELGMAYASNDKVQQAVEALKRAIVLASPKGSFDHQVTCQALLELGRLHFEAARYDEAAKFFLEATYAAYQYREIEFLEEALRYGQITHLVSNKAGIYPPTESILTWARMKRYRELEVSGRVGLAENLLVLGQTAKAKTIITDARGVMGTRDIRASRTGARLEYVHAQTNYQSANRREADAALEPALKFQRTASHRLFQIGLIDKLAAKFTPTRRVKLYEKVLADPTKEEWAKDPLEYLALVSTPHSTSYELWFDAAIEAADIETAFEISELTRRHRFLSTLPLGGRVHALRTLLEGPDDLLDPPSVLQRQDLQGRYPKYAELSRQAKQLRSELKSAELLPTDNDAQQKQRGQLTKLGQLAQQQEVILHEMALRREATTWLFPPAVKWAKVQTSLPKGTALWSFFARKSGVHVFMLNNTQYDHWKLADAEKIKKLLPNYLKALGNHSQNNDLSGAQLKDTAWLTQGKQLAELLLRGSRADLNEIPSELIIVPDGPLWYLPFEALPVGRDDRLVPLVTKVRVRYLPLASLVASQRSAPARLNAGQVAVSVGKIFPQDDPAASADLFQDLKRGLPKAEAAPLASWQPSIPSTIQVSLADGLVVLDEIDPLDDNGLDWSPTQWDRAKTGSSLADWFLLPFGGPEYVILPGLRTICETGLKPTKGTTGDGREIFQAVCGLLANGSRTVLLSRWRTGGKTTHDLVREFCKELPHAPAADAWQRAVLLAHESPLDPAREPRVKNLASETVTTASHPFFWSGYLLIDTAPTPTPEKAVAARPEP